jgi:type I restriction enzyme S subunit
MPEIKFVRFGKLLKFLPKSKIKAGDGQESGKYPFFKSGNEQTKFIDTAIFEGESLIIGDGGSANIKYYDKKFSASDHCFVIQKEVEYIDVKYVYYYLRSNIKILENGFKGAGLRNISKKYISEINIPLLPQSDQQKIAQLLTQIEDLISTREESIQLLDDLTKSTFLDMFGDPVINPKNLKKEKLKKFGKIITGNTPPRVENKFYDSDFIEWVKTDNLFEDKLFATKSKECLSEEGLKVGRKVREGSLLVTCIAGSVKSIGTACLVDRSVSFNQQINAIEPYEGVDSFFLYQLFKISKQYVQHHAGKGMKKIINKSTFENILFPMPENDLQKKYGEIFENIEKTKTIYQDSLKELNNLFGSIAQKAFKGELDIRGIELFQKEQEEITMAMKLDENKLIEEIKKGDFILEEYLEPNKKKIKHLRTLQRDLLEQKKMQQVEEIAKHILKLENALLNDQDNYNEMKKLIFTLIKDGKISQKFDNESKKIILEAK